MTIQELNRKDVIQQKTGENLGRIDDIIFDEVGAQITGVILHGRSKLFGLLGREEDLTIAWQDIVSIGADVVIVDAEVLPRPARSRGMYC